jgi:hypothetical protein
MQTKNIFLKQTEKLSIFLLTVFFSVVTYAQTAAPDLKVDVTKTTTSTTDQWYSNPIYWVVGAVVLIIIIALITRGNNNNGNNNN